MGGLPFDITRGQATLRTLLVRDPNPRLGTYLREYLVSVPPGYTGTERLPVLFYFHDQDPDWQCTGCHFVDQGNLHGFIVVKPKGKKEGTAFYTWNVGANRRSDVCVHADTTPLVYQSCRNIDAVGPCSCYTCYDDVQFVADLLESLQSELCMDASSIFATGASNGAMFLYYLVAEFQRRRLPHKFRAIAPWYGAFFRDMQEVPWGLLGMSIFHSHGTHDEEIPPSGQEAEDGFLYTPVQETLRTYARLNGCGLPVRRWTAFDGRGSLQQCYGFTGCLTGSQIVRCNFNEGHGFWPPFAEDMTWQFFRSTLSGASGEAANETQGIFV